MFNIQTLNPSLLNDFLELQKDILIRKFPEPRKTNKKGRPTVGFFWVIAGICIISRIEGITWRDLPVKLANCDFLIKKGYLRRIPHYSTFNRYWNKISVISIETWISRLGAMISDGKDIDIAIDSTGYKLRFGRIWRFLKWTPRMLLRSSKIFRKVHIIIGVQSRAIIAITTSKARYHDFYIFPRVWKKCFKRLL